MNWHLNSEVIGLSLLTISPGFASSEASPIAANEAKARALTETAIIGFGAALVSKSYWPIVVPIFYLAFDYFWLQMHAPKTADAILSDSFDAMGV